MSLPPSFILASGRCRPAAPFALRSPRAAHRVLYATAELVLSLVSAGHRHATTVAVGPSSLFAAATTLPSSPCYRRPKVCCGPSISFLPSLVAPSLPCTSATPSLPVFSPFSISLFLFFLFISLSLPLSYSWLHTRSGPSPVALAGVVLQPSPPSQSSVNAPQVLTTPS